jgi:hypothetical protein
MDVANDDDVVAIDRGDRSDNSGSYSAERVISPESMSDRDE